MGNWDAATPYVMRDFYGVEREKVRDLARSLRDTNPLHHSVEAAREAGYPDVVAPVTMMSLAALHTTRDMVDVIIATGDLTRILHVDQQIEVERPPVAGDMLSFAVELESHKEMSEVELMVIKVTITNQDDVRCGVVHATLAHALTGPDTTAAMEVADAVMMFETGPGVHARN